MSNNVNNNDEILSNTDIDRIEKTFATLEKIIDDITDHGNTIPGDVEKIEVLKSTAESLNKSIVNLAKFKQQMKKDQQDTDNEAKKIAIMREAALQRKAIQERIQKENTEVIDTLPDSLVPNDIKPGEMDVIPEELDIKDFVNSGEDDE